MDYISFVYNKNTFQYEEYQTNASQHQIEIMEQRAKAKGCGFTVMTMHISNLRSLV